MSRFFPWGRDRRVASDQEGAFQSDANAAPDGSLIRLGTDPEEIDEVLSLPSAVVYKHSPICWQSSMTIREMDDFARAHPNTPVFLVDVVGNRASSNRLAERLKIRHESPQVIVVKEGKPVWDASHFQVERAAVERALQESLGVASES